MPGIGTVLDIGRWALFGNQAAIETTGNNIANANTPGYTRRTVEFQENNSLDFRPGQIGTGVSPQSRCCAISTILSNRSTTTRPPCGSGITSFGTT